MDKATTVRAKDMDDAAVARAQKYLDAKGIKVDIAVMKEALAAAETPPPPDIAVSPSMLDVGRKVWLQNPSASPHVLLPMLYRVMEQQRRDEEAIAP